MTEANDLHEVFAVRYAHHDRQSPENFLFGDPHDILQPLAYFVWVIKGPHGTFVVDTGFDEAMKKKRGHVVLASDATHLYGHINAGRVFPVTFCVGDVLEGYATIRKLADSLDHIVPGHDPAVVEKYPAAAPGLEKLVVRLDVPPR